MSLRLRLAYKILFKMKDSVSNFPPCPAQPLCVNWPSQLGHDFYQRRQIPIWATIWTRCVWDEGCGFCTWMVSSSSISITVRGLKSRKGIERNKIYSHLTPTSNTRWSFLFLRRKGIRKERGRRRKGEEKSRGEGEEEETGNIHLKHWPVGMKPYTES